MVSLTGESRGRLRSSELSLSNKNSSISLNSFFACLLPGSLESGFGFLSLIFNRFFSNFAIFLHAYLTQCAI